MKDNFSLQSDDYARFRPQYPQHLIDYLLRLVNQRAKCWDCGTGNGQLAVQLSAHFEEVHATDISEKQLANATQKQNIFYSKQPAEKTSFADHQFDLITVAQAAHWFDHARFNMEVKRVLRPEGVLALIGYGLVQVEGEIGEIIKAFYWNVTKPFWDPERDHIEARYETIPFPYDELRPDDSFDIAREMSLQDLVGYISTWSAVQHYTKANGVSPIPQLWESLSDFPKEIEVEVTFPVFTRIGRLTK